MYNIKNVKLFDEVVGGQIATLVSRVVKSEIMKGKLRTYYIPGEKTPNDI